MIEPAVEVQGLVKRFGQVTAIDGLSFEIQPGECFGLLGPNGAGKSTTLEILLGLQQPTEGRARVLGKSWEQHAPWLRTRVGVQLQESRFMDRLTVLETLRLFRSFYPTGLSAEEAMGLVQLEAKGSAQVQFLSGGQRQRLSLAVALIGEPELLFLDEPTTGLDPQARRALWAVVEGLKRSDRTVLLTTHYLEEAERLCDRVAIVDHGKLVVLGAPAALIAEHAGEAVVEFESVAALDDASLLALPGALKLQAHEGLSFLSVRQLQVALPALMALAEQRGLRLSRLNMRHASLDEVFLALTGRNLREESS